MCVFIARQITCKLEQAQLISLVPAFTTLALFTWGQEVTEAEVVAVVAGEMVDAALVAEVAADATVGVVEFRNAEAEVAGEVAEAWLAGQR